MSICGGPKELPQRDLQGRTTAQPNAPFKMKGSRDRAGLKWRPISESQSGTQR